MALDFITAVLAPGAAKSTKHEYISSSGDDKQSFGSKIDIAGLPHLFIPGKQGGFIDVIVAYIESTEKFFCQLQDQAEDIIQMSEELNVYYAQPNAKSLFNPVTGTLCAAKYSADNCWYRGYILDRPAATSLQVYFLDYGNVENVCKVDVKVLVPEFLKHPPRAIPCKLKQVQNTPEVVSKFMACGDSYNFILQLENVVDSSLEVTVFDVNLETKVECNINDYLNGQPTCIPSKLCAKRHPDPAGQKVPQPVMENGDGSRAFQKDQTFGAAGDYGRRDMNKSSSNGFDGSSRPSRGFGKDSGGSNFTRNNDNSSFNDRRGGGFGDRGGGGRGFREVRGQQRRDGDSSGAENWRSAGGFGQATSGRENRLPSDSIANTFAVPKDVVKSVCDFDDETITIAENFSSPKAIPSAVKDAVLPSVGCITISNEGAAASAPKSFPPFKIPPRDDAETDVLIAWAVDVDEFYVQLVSQEDELQTVTEKLQDYCSGGQAQKLVVAGADLRSGVVCAAKYAEDQRFYRCTVTNVDGQNADVHFVDYGNKEVVPVDQLYKLTDEFVSHPRYAVRCCFKHLTAVTPDDKSSFKSDVDSLAVDQSGDPVVFRCSFVTKVEPCEVQLKRDDLGLDDMVVSLNHFVKC